jgi:hypothetical protein
MKRFLAVLCLLAVAWPAPAQDEAQIRRLLQRLDDDSIEVRAAAAAELSRLGSAVLPQLKQALADAGPESRDRLAEIIRKIVERERLSALLPPPSLITLEAKNRPLNEVLQQFGKQSRTPIDLTNVPEDARVTVSLRKAPYWMALEELCRASGRVMAEPEGDRISVTAEPYVALPQLNTSLFRVKLQQIDLTCNGTLGQPDRFEHFGAMFDVCWEKGAKPWRLLARIAELIDESGDDLAGNDQDGGFTVVPADAIHLMLPVDCQHGPGPQATKIPRLKVEVLLDFPLRYAEVKLPIADGKLPPPGDCPEYSVRLTHLERQEGNLVASLTLTPGVSPIEGADLLPESVVLRDAKGILHTATMRPDPQPSDTEFKIEAVFSDAPAAETQWRELTVRLPADVHHEKLEIDLKDVPLK